MKKLISMLMILTLVLLAPLSVGYAAPAPAATVHYLALGDSIAAGTDNISIQNALKSILARYPKITLLNYVPLMAEITLLQSRPETYLKGNSFRYTYQFRDYLRKKTSATIGMTDWAVSGYTSEQLLNQLKKLNTVGLAVLKHAEYITISIGGNDILPAGAESGFSYVDTALLNKNVTAYKSNLSATLGLIKKYNPTATVILMNFFNLYHPKEMSTNSLNLYKQVDDLLNPKTGSLGAWLMKLPASYPKLRIADTYSLFDTVNKATGATKISTAYTYAVAAGAVFPMRFKTKANDSVVYTPHASADYWNKYVSDYKRLALNSSAIPLNAGVAFDFYNQFYNPNNFVFEYAAASSDIYQLVKGKCDAVTWPLMQQNLDKTIGKYEKWRDVHNTQLGHSLITRANIDAIK